MVPRAGDQGGDRCPGGPLVPLRGFSNTHLWLAGVGLVLFAVGLGLAIWARMQIGRNWGTPMTQKDEPELVTSGPYHLVRHPIYSGILVADVGTAVALSWLWLIAVALAGVYFVYSAKVEEHYLTERFPDAYLMGCSGRAATSSSAATVSPVTSQLICRRQCPGARSCLCPVIPLWP